MSPAHLCGTLRGVEWNREMPTQDRDLDSFGPRETSSGNNPTCCLWLGLIMIMRESPVSRLFVSSPRDCSCCLSPFGEPCPSLCKLEGRVTMWSPSRTRTSLSSTTSRIQVRVLIPCKGNIPYTFLLKSAHHHMNRPTGTWALSSV